MRCADQDLSPSRSLAVASSRIGGSTVLSAANIHEIARARAFAFVWQQAHMAPRDVEHDRPRLEQAEIAFLVGRESARKDEAPDGRVPSSP